MVFVYPLYLQTTTWLSEHDAKASQLDGMLTTGREAEMGPPVVNKVTPPVSGTSTSKDTTSEQMGREAEVPTVDIPGGKEADTPGSHSQQKSQQAVPLGGEEQMAGAQGGASTPGSHGNISQDKSSSTPVGMTAVSGSTHAYRVQL